MARQPNSKHQASKTIESRGTHKFEQCAYWEQKWNASIFELVIGWSIRLGWLAAKSDEYEVWLSNNRLSSRWSSTKLSGSTGLNCLAAAANRVESKCQAERDKRFEYSNVAARHSIRYNPTNTWLRKITLKRSSSHFRRAWSQTNSKEPSIETDLIWKAQTKKLFCVQRHQGN